MLADQPIQPVLQATDLGAVRAFYHDLLGLPILGESDRHLVFRCGGGTQLAVSKSTTGNADTRRRRPGWLTTCVRRWPGCARAASRSRSRRV
jgi:catechol-2,3-dioxygenase